MKQTASFASRPSLVASGPPRAFPLALGNHLVGLIQAKVTLNQPGDTYEQEADRVAEHVMRTREPGIRGTCTGCSSGAGLCHQCAASQEATPPIQRALDVHEISGALETPGEEEELLQRSADGHTGVAPSRPARAVRPALAALSGQGRPLPAAARAFLEPRMGHDFADIRVHTDHRADELARSVGARAFTQGNHIVFRSGAYDPESSTGRRLLAHELTHTIQQKATGDLPVVQRMGDTSKIPDDLKCFVPNITGVNPGTSILFAQKSSALDAPDKSTLSSIAAAWHAGGRAGVLTITGFASLEGDDPFNWRLSCDRALAVARELEAPTDLTPGVPAANIRTNAQGETSEFSATALGPNRRVVIVTTGGAPAPGPTCPLTITGLDQVDHYCAPYVPSNAASCGVYPAPPITLTAVGAAPGATLRWSIIKGNIDRAYIDGPANSTTVNIRGYRPSLAPRDVTVQLTDGHCTVTHRLTVRQPSRLAVTEAKSRGTKFILDLVTYTVQDQFGNAMGGNICLDETVTICANNSGHTITFRDAATDPAGQVRDRLRSAYPVAVPLDLCVKADQLLTAGGCGPLLRNTILMQWTGVTLTPGGGGCAVGDPCP